MRMILQNRGKESLVAEMNNQSSNYSDFVMSSA